MRSGTHRRFAAAFAAFLALALVGAGSASAAKDNTVWLCKPGLADNPCKPGFGTTTISPTGEVLGTETPKADRKPKADCFYVYPTVSDDQTVNSDLSIDPEERSIALYQAARYSLHCRVFAPMYRQVTLQALFGGGITDEAERARLRRRGQRLEDLPREVQQGPRGDPDRPLPGHLRPAPADRTTGSTRSPGCASG